jgi:putative SOS response-associated peptidase YedK
MAEIHDRMPIMLPPDAWDTWLDRDVQDPDLLGKFLVPAPSSVITFHPVSTEVNNVRNQGEHLLEPVDLDDEPAAGAEDG